MTEKSFINEEVKLEEEIQRIGFKEKKKLLHLEEISTIVNLMVNQDIDINLENISFNDKSYSIKMNSRLSDDSDKNYNHEGEIIITCSDGRSLSINEEIKTIEETRSSYSGWYSWEEIEYRTGIVCSYKFDNSFISLYFNKRNTKLKKIKEFINGIGTNDFNELVYDNNGKRIYISRDFNRLQEYIDGFKYYYSFDFSKKNICKLFFFKEYIGKRKAELLIDENEAVLLEGNDKYNNEIIEDNISSLEQDKTLIKETIEKSKTDYPIKKLQKIIYDLDEKIDSEKKLKEVYGIALDIFSRTNDMLNVRNMFMKQKIGDYIFSEAELLLIINLLKDITKKLNEEREIKINKAMEGLTENELKVLRKKIGK